MPWVAAAAPHGADPPCARLRVELLAVKASCARLELPRQHHMGRLCACR